MWRLLLVAAALVTGCGPLYEYVPTRQALLEDAPGSIDGHLAAGYDAREGVRGEIRVAVVGVARVPQAEGPVLHARLVVHNRSDVIWSIDSTRQLGVVGSDPPRRPVLAAFEGSDVSLAVVMPGETRTADLYYELPAGATPAPAFRLDWRVDTPGRVLAAKQTPFERHDKTRPKLEASATLHQCATCRDGNRAPFHDYPNWRD